MTVTDPQRLMDLWTVPPDERPDPRGAFAEVYADPVVINGEPLSVDDIVARARALHAAFSDHTIEIVQQFREGEQLAVAFRHTARHTGVWATPLGSREPTGATVHGLGIDLLSFDDDGRVVRIWVLADELQRILQVSSG